MKVVTVVGTRPEIIRLSRVMAALDAAIQRKHIVIHTGQNYDFELNGIFFEQMGIRPPDYVLDIRTNSAIETIGSIMTELEKHLRGMNPDALLILGDTNSCLAAAYVAKRLKIPLFHMEAGNRSFDQRVPEEINRVMIDHISDINLPYSSIARECLMREGLPTDRTIKTGSPMFEVLNHYRAQIDASNILQRLGLVPQKYFVVSSHREENTESLQNLQSLVNALAEKYQQPVIVSTHPRIAKRVDQGAVSSLVKFHKPFGFFDYVHLQENARATLSDSGTITEESSILNFPALNLREAHERPEGMEEGSVILTGFNHNRIFESISVIAGQGRGVDRTLQVPTDYSTPNVSEKVVRIILSYTDYVNRIVWRKSWSKSSWLVEPGT
jgi:UDP-N-acetylglucosamine 2-epimerase